MAFLQDDERQMSGSDIGMEDIALGLEGVPPGFSAFLFLDRPTGERYLLITFNGTPSFCTNIFDLAMTLELDVIQLIDGT